MNTLHGHIAVVTGAGSGVGQAIACALAAQGATLCLVGRTPATLEATACSVNNAKVVTRCYPTDLTHDDAVQTLAEQLHHEWDAIDILVHSAGVFAMGKLETTPVTELDLPIPHECARSVSADAGTAAPTATAAGASGLYEFACRHNSRGAGGVVCRYQACPHGTREQFP